MEDSPTVLRDVFPADVTFANGSVLGRCRVVLTERSLYLWREVDGAPELFLDEPWDPAESSIGNRWSVPPYAVVTPGGTVLVNRGAGCGCGSVLKSARLFAGAMRSGDR